MQISSRAGAAAAILLAVVGAASAGEPYPTAIDAYRQGLDAHRSGQREAALRALDYAAERGVLGAQLKLARMYENGDGVPRSPGKAFRLYQRVADVYAETSPTHPIARFVAEAFVAVGNYYRTGIPEIDLAPDKARSVGMYRHAASYFGDAAAQYELARMYLAGEGVQKDVGLAVNWLANAIKKHHAPSQALLGDILCRGRDEIRPQPRKGLALLALARENATKEELVWIEPLYASDMAAASSADREAALKLFQLWRRNQPDSGQVAAAGRPPAATPKAGDHAGGRDKVDGGPAGISPASAASPAAQPEETAARPAAAVIDVPQGARPNLPPVGLTHLQNVGTAAPVTPR